MAVKVVEGGASHALNTSEVRAWMAAALCFQTQRVELSLVSRMCCTHARVCAASPLLIHLFVLCLSFVLRLIHPASLVHLLHIPRLSRILRLMHSSTCNQCRPCL